MTFRLLDRLSGEWAISSAEAYAAFAILHMWRRRSHKNRNTILSFAQRILCTGRKEDREGLMPMPKILLWQMAAADWRQHFVPFKPSCKIYNSSEGRTRKRRQYACERL